MFSAHLEIFKVHKVSISSWDRPGLTSVKTPLAAGPEAPNLWAVSTYSQPISANQMSKSSNQNNNVNSSNSNYSTQWYLHVLTIDISGMLKITVSQPFAVHPRVPCHVSTSKDRQGVLYCQGVEARCKVMTWLFFLAPNVVSA